MNSCISSFKYSIRSWKDNELCKRDFHISYCPYNIKVFPLSVLDALVNGHGAFFTKWYFKLLDAQALKLLSNDNQLLCYSFNRPMKNSSFFYCSWKVLPCCSLTLNRTFISSSSFFQKLFLSLDFFIIYFTLLFYYFTILSQPSLDVVPLLQVFFYNVLLPVDYRSFSG